ncbi:MAG: hypothetical protein ACQEW5_25945 [Bacillota bacterium]
MLYTVVICDLVFKLTDLKEIHGDAKAEKILNDLEVEKELNPVSPAWEAELIEKSFKEAKILENDVFTHIETLKKYRNLSAHPVLNSMDILFRPSKELSESLIKNMLEGLLTKHPLFTKNVFSPFMEELERIKDNFATEVRLETYLDSKFFVHFNKELTEYMFKNLWKIVFKNDAEPAKRNRKINYDVLLIIYKNYQTILLEYIKKEPAAFSDYLDKDNILTNYIDFLSRYPEVFHLLQEHTQEILKNSVKKKKSWLVRSIFISESLRDHLVFIDSNIHGETYHFRNAPYSQSYLLTQKDVVYLNELAKANGTLSEFYDLMISHYSHSGSFDDADYSFDRCIRPFYEEFNKEQFKTLLDEVTYNPQCYGGMYGSRNKRLLEPAQKLIPDIDVEDTYKILFK